MKIFESLKWIEYGEFRYSDKNRAFISAMMTPEYAVTVYLVLAFFENDTVAIGFYSNQALTDNFENITTFTYQARQHSFNYAFLVDNTYMIKNFTDKEMRQINSDLTWVAKTVDKYAASWKND